MIRINQIKIPIFEPDQYGEIRKKAARLLKIPDDGFRKFKIVKRSIDARDKNDILFSYTVDCKLRDTFTGPRKDTEKLFIDKLRKSDITQIDMIPVTIPDYEGSEEKHPVIVGAGPCGLFAALALCSAGVKPIIVERGKIASERDRDVEKYFETGILDTQSNVQFGEGGAGLFSDGKLNTSIKGKENYVRFVLETFNEFGADDDILIDAKPHIGTDVLKDVIRNMHEYIEENGGEFIFETRFTGFETDENGAVNKALFEGKVSEIETDTIILATGHSARDTFEYLHSVNVKMEKKPFAVGLRIQHPQEVIDRALYGAERLLRKQAVLGPGAYKVTHECENGRGVYSFCMCPGGFVINSSSGEGETVVNGMSFNKRDSSIANAAIIVTVSPDDFPGDELSGIEFQRSLEKKAFELAGGLIPFERYGEFKRAEEMPTGEGSFDPAFMGMALPANLRTIFPEDINSSLIEGIEAFNKRIPGFSDDDAVLAGVESRTSSPVRIVRNEETETSVRGLYAAGEGAGYAGGITSAAVDGLKVAINVIGRLNNG
ncbi:MAG: FAD-dependent monooxygenase [Eubacteriales bacterium]|nr:FAD-dependent monooxygenase [Eubacteriales bacterium]